MLEKKITLSSLFFFYLRFMLLSVPKFKIIASYKLFYILPSKCVSDNIFIKLQI